MEEKYTKAFKEVYLILNRASKEELSKIPKTFVEFIESNMDKKYNPQIDFYGNFNQSVSEETLLILALIYRDYLISEEEREILLQDEKKQLEELKESYNIENLFIKRQQESEKSNVNIEKQLTMVKKEKWYMKILNKILSLLKNK